MARRSSSSRWSRPATGKQIAALKAHGNYDGKYYSMGRASQTIGRSMKGASGSRWSSRSRPIGGGPFPAVSSPGSSPSSLLAELLGVPNDPESLLRFALGQVSSTGASQPDGDAPIESVAYTVAPNESDATKPQIVFEAAVTRDTDFAGRPSLQVRFVSNVEFGEAPPSPPPTFAAGSSSMASRTKEKLLVDPTEFVGSDSRLFIDANVFMDTEAQHHGGLKGLFERVAPTIQGGGSPVVVPTKVMDELAKHGSLDPAAQDDRAEAVKKAANALTFLRSAEAQGLVRNDLGDETNPYADDLFVRLFEAYSERYAMMLITNDITLLLRINVLGAKLEQRMAAGVLASDGAVECEAPQSLYERGLRKLQKIRARVDAGDAGPRDEEECTSLEAVLTEYQSAFGTTTPKEPRSGKRSVNSRGDVRPARSQVFDGAFSPEPDFKGEDEVLDVAEIPGQGDEVLVESQAGSQTLRLGDMLGEGGEGSVYSVSDRQVVKIYDPEHITRHREEKIKMLVSRAFAEPGICFPQAIVKNLDGDLVGYLMPRAHGREFSKVIFSRRRFRKEFPHWTKADLVDVAISFLEKVSYLHSLNIILGDINPKNLQVDANKGVWIIDADSWQVEGYPCPVGTEMFSAPAVIGRRYPEFLRSTEDERFAVATMLFMILITGQFPYARSGSDGDIVRLIKEGNFAFQYKEHSNQDQPAGDWKYMWSHIHKDVKGLFWHTFHKSGSRYKARPTDSEWLQAFREYRRYLASNANFDPMSNDVFPTRFKAMSADTPIYECAECETSLAGIWNDRTSAYVTPKLCLKCRSSLPKCVDCGKHKDPKSLKEGRCYTCNRRLNFATCGDCGREKPRKALIDGRCYDCNQGTCSDCGRTIPKRYLANDLCDRCEPVACKDCGANLKKSKMSYGRCPSCHKLNADRQAQRRREQAERRKRAQTLDASRLCTRCGKPFITYGNIAWHERNYKPIPTTHKRNHSGTYPPECVPEPTGQSSKANKGCFVATAVYGSFDCPEVWALRRWRDSTLLQTRHGRAFVCIYYATSPGLVKMLGSQALFRTPTKWLLDTFVDALVRSGISVDPYRDAETSRSLKHPCTNENGDRGKWLH